MTSSPGILDNEVNEMNRTQRILAVTYGAVTILILLCHLIYTKNAPSLILTFTVRASMVALAFLLPTAFREKKRLRAAFFFTLVSDFFFIFVKLYNPDMPNREMYGMMGFILAYFFLTWTFSDRLRLGRRELLTFLPFITIFLILFMTLRQYASGFMYPVGIGIGLMLSITGMATVSTTFRGYFTKRAALFIAIAGAMMFFSDLFVAYSIYHPAWKEFMLWKENMIWGTYVPAWTMLLLLMAEDQPYREPVAEDVKGLNLRKQRHG